MGRKKIINPPVIQFPEGTAVANTITLAFVLPTEYILYIIYIALKKLKKVYSNLN